jgi:hypothetical protein
VTPTMSNLARTRLVARSLLRRTAPYLVVGTKVPLHTRHSLATAHFTLRRYADPRRRTPTLTVESPGHAMVRKASPRGIGCVRSAPRTAQARLAIPSWPRRDSPHQGRDTKRGPCTAIPRLPMPLSAGLVVAYPHQPADGHDQTCVGVGRPSLMPWRTPPNWSGPFRAQPNTPHEGAEKPETDPSPHDSARLCLVGCTTQGYSKSHRQTLLRSTMPLDGMT